jgi:hypothetical protein
VSTFYLLPPRILLGQRLAAVLGISVPEPERAGKAWTEFVDTLGTAMAQTDVYIVHREDLPPDEDPAQALADGYGAAAGDEVIEVRASAGSTELTMQRWRIGPLAA